jgi:hypothetical protein
MLVHLVVVVVVVVMQVFDNDVVCQWLVVAKCRLGNRRCCCT